MANTFTKTKAYMYWKLQIQHLKFIKNVSYVTTNLSVFLKKIFNGIVFYIHFYIQKHSTDK